jgi:predicted hydrolase (HD superfamily)
MAAKETLTRFELFVILRNQVKERVHVRRALAVEATMEELAAELGQDARVWAMAGLGAFIDAELQQVNVQRRGEVAEEILLTEGAPGEVAAAARARLGVDPAAMSVLAAALAAAEALVGEVWAQLDAGDRLDDIEGLAVARRVSRAAERRGDENAARLLALVARIGVGADRAAELTLAGMRRVREDLKL